MQDHIKKLMFSGLLLSVTLFFFSSLKAAESIPATGTQVYNGLCTGTNQNFMRPTTPTPSGSTHSANGDYPDCTHLVDTYATSCQQPKTISAYQQVNNNLAWPGGQDDVKADINCGSWYTGTLTVGTATLDWHNPITEYTCPEDYELNGQMCDPIEPEPCSFDMPVFVAPSYIPHNRICVENSGMRNSCSYTATSEDSGVNNGVTFTPTSESCGCETVGTTPCASLDDSLGTPNPDENNCTEVGGMNWCQADPEQRCTNGDITTCETNCGYINDVFMCGDQTLPDSSACISGDNRAICVGVPEGQCPAGYDCSGYHNNQNNDTSPCQSGDARPECVGVPDGGSPNINIDTGNIEALLRQGNMNTEAIRKELEGQGVHPSQLEAKIQEKINQFKADLDSQTETEKSFLETTSEAETTLSDGVTQQSNIVGALVTDLVPTPSGDCNPYNADFGLTIITIDICSSAPLIRAIFAWAINIAMAFYLFHAITRRMSPMVVSG